MNKNRLHELAYFLILMLRQIREERVKWNRPNLSTTEIRRPDDWITKEIILDLQARGMKVGYGNGWIVLVDPFVADLSLDDLIKQKEFCEKSTSFFVPYQATWGREDYNYYSRRALKCQMELVRRGA